MIRPAWRPKNFREDGFQAVGPDLVAFQTWMQLVLRDAFEEFSILVQFVIHVEKTNLLSVSHPGQMVVDPVDRRDDRHVVVSRKEGGENDDGARSLLLADVYKGLQPACDVLHLGLAAGNCSDVVDAREHHDDFWVNFIEFPVLQTPQHVFDQVSAPAEIGRVPAEEICVPVREQFRVVGRAPPPRDRVADEINVNAPFPGFFDQLLVGNLRIPVGSRRSERGRRRSSVEPKAECASHARD